MNTRQWIVIVLSAFAVGFFFGAANSIALLQGIFQMFNALMIVVVFAIIGIAIYLLNKFKT
ncbi:hypothetical protein HY967_02770 [Candidatus Jorgensenbacteria bacterium]|nr:hypothetical protein [Candidatus Jorgensenbacteria bacterium]